MRKKQILCIECGRIAGELYYDTLSSYAMQNNTKHKTLLGIINQHLDEFSDKLSLNSKESKVIRNIRISRTKIKMDIIKKIYNILEKPKAIGDYSNGESIEIKEDNILDTNERKSWELSSEVKSKIKNDRERVNNMVNENSDDKVEKNTENELN